MAQINITLNMVEMVVSSVSTRKISNVTEILCGKTIALFLRRL